MQALVGLFLFCALLTIGTSLDCEICATQGSTCTGSKQTCGAGLDTCLTLVVDGTVGGTTTTSVAKMCFAKEACDILKPGASFNSNGVSGTIKEATCKAPAPSASLLLAFLGLLVLKALF